MVRNIFCLFFKTRISGEAPNQVPVSGEETSETKALRYRCSKFKKPKTGVKCGSNSLAAQREGTTFSASVFWMKPIPFLTRFSKSVREETLTFAFATNHLISGSELARTVSRSFRNWLKLSPEFPFFKTLKLSSKLPWNNNSVSRK